MRAHAVDKSIDSPYTLAISSMENIYDLRNKMVTIQATPRSSVNQPRRSAGQERLRCFCFAFW